MIYLNRKEVLKKYEGVIGNTYHLRDQLDEFIKQELHCNSGFECDASSVMDVLNFCIFCFSLNR